MTPWLCEIQKNIFSKVQTIWWTDILSKRFVDSQMMYLLHTLWLLMLQVNLKYSFVYLDICHDT